MRHAGDDYNHIQDPSGKIPDDEPVFLLRGQDVVAPYVLEYYAEALKDHDCEREMVNLTPQQAHEMRQWQRNITKKLS